MMIVYTIFIEYLKISKFNKKDAILVYSVGGGNLKRMSLSILLKQSIILKKSLQNLFVLWAKTMDMLIRM